MLIQCATFRSERWMRTFVRGGQDSTGSWCFKRNNIVEPRIPQRGGGEVSPRVAYVTELQPSGQRCLPGDTDVLSAAHVSAVRRDECGWKRGTEQTPAHTQLQAVTYS